MWGGAPSVITGFILYSYVLLRLLSPLQWVKVAYRRRRREPSHADMPPAALSLQNEPAPPPQGHRARSTSNVRPDVPPIVTELYFLTVLAVLITLYSAAPSVRELRGHTPLLSSPLEVLSSLFALESFSWITYYLLIRQISERRFTIYSPAEYLFTLPFVVAVQCFAIAIAISASPRTILLDLMGKGGLHGWFGTISPVLSFVYLSVALVTLLSSYPRVEIRLPETIAVIGSGDVVRNRVLPALAWHDLKPREVKVLTPDFSAPRKLTGFRVMPFETSEGIIKWLRSERLPTIVASPTSSHMHYILSLWPLRTPFAVEKPLSLRPEEWRRLKRNPRWRENLFPLSYYSLEKALPLTYALTGEPAFAQYLNVTGIDRLSIQERIELLGKLKSVTVSLIESRDRSSRLWTEDSGKLADLGELAIHPLVLLAHLIEGDPLLSELDTCKTGIYEPRRAELARQGVALSPTSISFTAKSHDIGIYCTVAKYAESEIRDLLAQYEAGTMSVDFDRRELRIEQPGLTPVSVQVKPSIPNYGVLMGLFRSFILDPEAGVRVTDLDEQLRALEAWHEICRLTEVRGIAACPYQDVLPVAKAGASPVP